jgi:predicted RND superfamily exporter protein
MVALDIGKKVNTLTVLALGVGIGVDYAIYIFARMREAMTYSVEFAAADVNRDFELTAEELAQFEKDMDLDSKAGSALGVGGPARSDAPAPAFADLDTNKDDRVSREEYVAGHGGGRTLSESYFIALKTTGIAIFYTALTLAVGVGTWAFSQLKFQADMGVMLTFMFVVNMIAAIVFLPALCRWLLRPTEKN